MILARALWAGARAAALIGLGVGVGAALGVGGRELEAQEEAAAGVRARGPLEPWRGFAGLELGQSLDAVLARNGQCWPALSGRQADPGYSPDAVAGLAFGYALPHRHPDSAAVRAALDNATICSLRVLEDHAQALVLGVARTVVAVTLWFNPQSRADSVSSDSIRKSLRRAWPGGAPSPRLDSWYGRHYRAFYLLPAVPPGMGWPYAQARLILLDVAACTAFDRRVHERHGSGAAEAC